ncbi:MAG: DUF6364 family protein [Cyclobacteriaceae bacterium]|jgi:hypothetical protein
MNAKLTLTIEKDVITDAKEYAKQKGLSLSKMVENYLVLITRTSKPGAVELTSIVKSLKGSFNAPDDFDYKDILSEQIAKKHL